MASTEIPNVTKISIADTQGEMLLAKAVDEHIGNTLENKNDWYELTRREQIEIILAALKIFKDHVTK